MKIVEIVFGRYAHGTQTPDPHGIGTLLGNCWHSFLELWKDGKIVYSEEERCNEEDPDAFEEKLSEKRLSLEEEWDEKLAEEYGDEELVWRENGSVYHKGLEESVKTVNDINITHYKTTVITYFFL